MSDINDLIHSNAVIAFQQGEKRERERIIKDFQAACRCAGEQTESHNCWADWAIKIVNQYWKGEQK